MGKRTDITGKLVRDKIPDIIRASGRIARVSKLDEATYRLALYDKLLEEADELPYTTTADDLVEEAADVLEVLLHIVGLHDRSLDDIVRVANQKRDQRGGFEDRIWLKVDSPDNRQCATAGER